MALRYTLVSDGSSDVVLLPILTWLLRAQGVKQAIQPEWADLRRLRRSSKPSLVDKIVLGIDLFPCDLLFVHRDAEKAPRSDRVAQIKRAIDGAGRRTEMPPTICVVPVRMQEAWLLFDESAIKAAAGNRRYHGRLELPNPKSLEQLPDPKSELHQLLKKASNLSGRRLKSFRTEYHARQVSEHTSDFSALRVLPAFAALEKDISQVVSSYNWATPGASCNL